MSQVEIDDAEWANPENWYLELFYFSRRDSRPFVPKPGDKDGLLGATVNFARPAGALFVVGIFAFVGLMFWLTRK